MGFIKKYIANLPLILWMGILVGCPLIYIFFLSFMSRNAMGSVVYQFTLDNYIRIFDKLYLRIFLRSGAIALGTAGLTLLLGYPFAYMLAKLPPRRKMVLLLLMMIPFWTNSLLRTYGFIILLRKDGVINSLLLNLGFITEPLNMMYNHGAIMMGMVYMLLPFMILPLFNAIDRLDRSLLEASRDLGAGPVRTFLSITLPLTMPGIISGVMLVFILAVGLFFISDLLGGAKTMLLGNLIEQQMNAARDWPFGAALSVVMALGVVCFLLLYVKNIGADGTEGGNPVMKKKSGLATVYMGAVMIFLYIPILLVVIYSFNASKTHAVWGGLTLDWYRAMMENTRLLDSLKISLEVAFLSAAVSAVIGTLGAVTMNNLNNRIRAAVSALAYAPLIIPEVIMGVALLMFLSLSPVSFGIPALVLGHSTFCIPYIMLMVNIRLDAIEPAVIEAARDLGANRIIVFTTITLPLILPGILTGCLLAVAMSMDDVIISFFLTGARETTLPVRIYSMLKLGVTPDVNALFSILLLFTFVIVGIIQWFTLNKKEGVS